MLFFSCFRFCRTIDEEDNQTLLYNNKPIFIKSNRLPEANSRNEYAEFMKSINREVVQDNIQVFTNNPCEIVIKGGKYIRYCVDFIRNEKPIYELYFILEQKNNTNTLTIKKRDSIHAMHIDDYNFLKSLFVKLGFYV